MKRFLKQSQLSILVGIFFTSCLGSKFLKNDEQILAKQEIVGLSGSLKDNSIVLLEQNKNTRTTALPFTHLAHMYQLGKNGIVFGPKIERRKMRLLDRREIYNQRIEKAESEEAKRQLSEKKERILTRKQIKIEKKKDAPKLVLLPGYNKDKAIAKKAELEDKYDRKIEKAKSEKKINKLKARKAKKSDKKERKVELGNQIMRWGEALSIYDPGKTQMGEKSIKEFLYSKGYFNAQVVADTASFDSLHAMGKAGRKLRNWVSRIAGAKYRYINLTFYVEKNQRYVIDSIQYVIPDPVFKELVLENKEKLPLKKGFYDQAMLSQERDFIYNLAVNSGYYDFSKQLITFQVDTVQLGQDTLMVRETIRNPEDKAGHEIFYLDSIVFVSNNDLIENFKRNTETFQGITFSFGKKKYSKKILEWRIPLEQDDRYSREQTIETQRQLSLLDNFKFVNINYDTIGNRFVANIFTSPFDKYQTSSEFGFSSTQGRPGPFINVNLKNRNTFNSLEVMSLDINAKLQDLRNVSDVSTDQLNGTYTSRQFGGEFTIIFPKFLFPLGSYYQNKIGKYNPQTRTSFGVTFEDRVSEYQRLTYQGTFAYGWQVSNRIKYSITPAKISWIDSQNDPDFQAFLDNLIAQGNSYANAFRSSVVNSASFERDQNIGNYGSGKEGGFIRTLLELGGLYNSFLSNSFFGDRLETFEFIKTNVDLRKITRLTSKYYLGYRFNVGYAYPFGENKALPYDKYFYAGGSSSIRGWKPRRLGPGSFAVFNTDDGGNETNVVNFDQEQPGEILLETSVELRRDLVGFVEGALFVDAGNIWRIENNSENPDFDKAVFEWDRFMKEIAIASGIGVRFDLQFLIFRVDLGFKIYDPAQPEGKRFVGDQILSDFDRNSEINIGIGYPF